MTTQSKRTVAFALCGSFCSFAAVLPQLRVLTARGWDVLPVLSASAAGLDTRFGTASALRQTLYEVTGHRPLTTLQAVEPLGPQRLAEGVYACPIVKLETDPEVDDEIPALTIYRKREVNIETERKPKTRTTEITADEFYVAVLSNEAKVVLAKFKA